MSPLKREQLTVHTVALGPLETNCYVLLTDGPTWVIDPGVGASALLDLLEKLQTTPDRVVLTHGHGDHIGGIPELRQQCGEIPIACPAGDAGMLTDTEANMSLMFGVSIDVGAPDETFEPGQVLDQGRLQWHVLDTSGHTRGGVSLYSPQAAVAITGDALFCRSVGRTDIPEASGERLLGNIRKHLLSLPGDTVILPGHGPSSTIGQEQQYNPFLGGGDRGDS